MMLSSGVAKQHDFTITFAEGVSKAFLLSVVLHSSETFQVPHTTSMKIFPKQVIPWFQLWTEKSAGILYLFQKIAVNLLTKDSRHLFVLCCYLQLYSLTFLAHFPRTLAPSSTVVITKPWTSVLRRCHMSAACFTCDLDLSSSHDH